MVLLVWTEVKEVLGWRMDAVLRHLKWRLQLNCWKVPIVEATAAAAAAGCFVLSPFLSDIVVQVGLRVQLVV